MAKLKKTLRIEEEPVLVYNLAQLKEAFERGEITQADYDCEVADICDSESVRMELAILDREYYDGRA